MFVFNCNTRRVIANGRRLNLNRSRSRALPIITITIVLLWPVGCTLKGNIHQTHTRYVSCCILKKKIWLLPDKVSAVIRLLSEWILLVGGHPQDVMFEWESERNSLVACVQSLRRSHLFHFDHFDRLLIIVCARKVVFRHVLLSF